MRSPDRWAVLLPATVATWLAYLAVDFLMHAVFLAPWWRATEEHWLPPGQLFERIPVGYLSFAIYAATLVWLIVRILGIQPTAGSSLRFGALLGTLFGTSSALAIYSVLDVPLSTLLVWPASTILGSLGGASAGARVLRAPRPWRQVGLVLLVVVATLIIGVVLQNVFFPTPPDRTVR